MQHYLTLSNGDAFEIDETYSSIEEVLAVAQTILEINFAGGDSIESVYDLVDCLILKKGSHPSLGDTIMSVKNCLSIKNPDSPRWSDVEVHNNTI